MPFPLYHGTSTLWQQSIREHGLGGRRIIEEFRALEFHRLAWSCIKSPPADWPVGAAYVMEQINAQSVTKGGFNFRHGGVYLTPSRLTATHYAIHNPFGSELLTHCHLLYEAILHSPDTSVPEWLEEYSALTAIFKRTAKPMLIRVNRVRADDLRDESGEPSPGNLRWLLNLIAESKAEAAKELERREALRKAIQAGDMESIASLVTLPQRTTTLTEDQIIETLGQQANFEANAVLPPTDLEFEEIRLES